MFGRVPSSSAHPLLPLLVGLAYLAAAVIGLAATQETNGLAALWPPNAILLATLLLHPRHGARAVAWCACASLAANLWFGEPPFVSLLFTVANMGGVVAAVALARRLVTTPAVFDRPAAVVAFSAAALTSATIGATIATLSVLLQPGSAGDVWLAWFLSDLLGILVIAPLILTLAAQTGRRVAGRTRPLETAALLGLVLLVTAACFYQSRYPLLFLPVAPLIAVTYRVGPSGTAIAVILIALIGTVATIGSHGPVALAAGGAAMHIRFLQLYLAVLFGISLPMAAALAHRRRLAATVAESERLLSLAGTVSRTGYWRFDCASERVTWSPEVFRLHGLDDEAEPDLLDAIAFFHPDDRPAVEHHVSRALGAGEDYSFDARVVRADGSVRHVVVDGRVERDDDGRVSGLFGVIQDRTERAVAAAELRASEERFRAITEQSGDMISLHTVAGEALFVSPSAVAILGHDPAAAFGPRTDAWIVPEDREALARMRAEVHAAAPDTGVLGRVRLRHADGGAVWMEVRARLTAIAGEPCAVKIWRDVSQQVESEAALRAARAEAEAALNAKAAFLANMSHEIRTPMNGVLGFAELLLGTDLTPEQRHHAQLIADSGKAMMKLLNDILDISKIDAGQLDIVSEPMDLAHTLRSCTTLLTPAAEQKGLTLELDLAPDLPRAILGDALRIRQVVLNLIGNAVKFTAVGGVILCVRRHAEGFSIAVRDTGIGIPPDRQPAIFEQFVQADSTIARQYGGTGLGLAISNRLAALMGGRLTLESVAGQGTTVTLILPLVAADETALPGRLPARAITPSADTRPAHVLLEDDHDLNQVLVTMMLARLGHRVTIANNGQEAVERTASAIADGAPFDLVLMDMQMPVLDGLAATRAIRALPGVGALPIVALTANAFAADLEACRAAGMDDHLAKPITADALRAALERWVPAQPARPRRRFKPSRELAERYAKQKAATLEALARAVRLGDFTDATVDGLADRLHKLAGTAAMFGDGALGDQARALEANLRAWDEDERMRRLREAADALRQVA